MEKKDWKYYVWRAFCWLLVVQMANISIDPPNVREHVFSCTQLPPANVNQIESLCELVTENLLDTEFPENDESDDVQKTVNPVVLFCSKPALQGFEITLPALQHRSSYTSLYQPLYTDPASPPPKMA